MNATVECLVECGYARTTTTLVAERAGVSRGAQLHHFPTKADLVIHAVAHLAARRRAQLVEEARALPVTLGSSGDRTDELLELVWSSFSGPLFVAALELWVAARTDAGLRENLLPFERAMGRAMAELWHELAGCGLRATGPGSDPGAGDAFDDALDLTVHLLRGMALQRILRDDDTARRRLFETWKGLMRGLLASEAARGAREKR